MSLHELSLTEIIAQIKSGHLSQKEVFEYFQERIRNLDPQIQAFDAVQEFSKDQPIDSILAGVPIGLKEVYSEK